MLAFSFARKEVIERKMAEPTKQQTGDSSDNYGNAARKMGQIAKEAGKTASKAATRATTNAAVSTVAGGAKVGKAVAGIAKGAAAGGIWGAVIAAAWSLKNTLFKILVCVCMFLLILIITIVSLPSIIFENLFSFGKDDFVGGGNALYASYDDLSLSIADVVSSAYQSTVSRVMSTITLGGYDLVLSMGNFTDNAMGVAEYDTCYILAYYSVSMGQNGTSKDNLTTKLVSVSDRMFPMTYTVKTVVQTIFDGIKELIKIVPYVVCTIMPFDVSVLFEAFDLDLGARYGNTGMTNGEYVDYLTASLKRTLGEERI